MTRHIEDCDQRLQDVWSKAAEKFKYYHPELTVFITCAYRSNEEQNILYAQGRTAEGHIVTNAKAGESPHNYVPSQAFDMAFKDEHNNVSWEPSLYQLFATIINSFNPFIVWGGGFRSIKDRPHFETNDWKKLKT